MVSVAKVVVADMVMDLAIRGILEEGAKAWPEATSRETPTAEYISSKNDQHEAKNTSPGVETAVKTDKRKPIPT
jgi:hypothetical protein